jgi:hypothetical protein
MKQRYFMSADVLDPERSWPERVFLASAAADPMGPIVRAVLGANPKNGAALGIEATIRKDGIVVAPLRDHSGVKLTDEHPLGDIMEMRDEFRRLADHCKLSDEDRLALFDMFKKWCGKDLRVVAQGSSF